MTSRARRAITAGLILLGLLVLACSPQGARRGGEISGAEAASAERQYAQILDAYRQGRIEEARALSVDLLDAHPGFHDAPALRLRLAESYLEEARWDLALHHLDRVAQDYPDSPERRSAQLLRAQALTESGRRLEAAVELDTALETWPAGSRRDRASSYLNVLIDRGLDTQDLEDFRLQRPHTPRLPRVELALAERYLRENRPEAAAPLLESVLATAPAGPVYDRAESLMARLVPGEHVLLPEQEAPLREGSVGVLAPLSGRFNIYGEAFLDGARLALDRFNSEHLTRYELSSADTAGEPVTAALAARGLILQDGVSALLGGVLSSPTVAAAVEANARRVPILSPAATAENIHELGEWVFQNNITSEAQVLSISRFTIYDLLGARFAVLYPKQGNGPRLARLFQESIDGLGGEIVAAIPYDLGMTDFSEPLEQIQEMQPEVLFLPGEVEQLMLIIPQLAYHDIHAQLVGNEAWNSRRLTRLAGERVEGAIFPSDVLLQRDRDLYREFLRLYERRFTTAVNPVAASSFLGMTTLLEILDAGALARVSIRDELALRLADTGDEAERREILADQVTLMTVRNGEIRPYDSYDFTLPGGDGEIRSGGLWSP
jgi:ABC-type branched-subunit amino acid transport system substrate-binding protein